MATGMCGIGGWGGPLAGDPDNAVVLSANTAYGGIEVSWTYPTTNPHAVAYFRIFRGTTNDFSLAVEIARVSGSLYLDRTSTAATANVTYYFWLQVVSINGTHGAIIGPASAIAYIPVSQMIEQLTGKIDNSVLATSLQTIVGGINSAVGASLADEIYNRLAAQNALNGVLTTAQNNITDVITYVQNETTQRTNSDTSIVNSVDIIAAASNDTAAALTTEQTTRASADTALASAITTAQTTLNGNIATAQTTLQTNIDTVSGNVTAIGARYTAVVNVNGLIGGFGIYNDGTTVDAGFDVDTFWVGKTNANKRKPFMIVGGVTYIDDAAIHNLTFDKLTATDGSAVISGGKLIANYIDSRGLSIKDALGNIILAAGTALDSSNITPAAGWLNSNLTASITAAQTTANTAVTNAGTANTALADIASDSKLTAVEKKPVRAEWDFLAGEKAGNNTQATTFAITTENTTYNTNFQALATYLNAGVTWSTGIPSWISDANLATTTTIVGATFRSTWKSFYDARIALFNAIALKSKTLADTAQTAANAAIKTDLTNAPAAVLNSNVTATGIGAVQTSLANAPAGILNSNVTATGIGAVQTSLANAPAAILNSSVSLGTLGYTGATNATANQTDAVTNAAISTAGTTASWSGVTGAGKAADYATVGATFGTNIGGQITSANASTFIAAAAIQSAQIGSLDANVINAGTITTDKLVVGSVTSKGTSAYSSVSLYAGAGVNVASLFSELPVAPILSFVTSGLPILVLCSGVVKVGLVSTTGIDWSVQLYVRPAGSGTVHTSIGGFNVTNYITTASAITSFGLPFAISNILTLPAGSWDVNVRVSMTTYNEFGFSSAKITNVNLYSSTSMVEFKV